MPAGEGAQALKDAPPRQVLHGLPRKTAITAAFEAISAVTALNAVPARLAGRGLIFTLHHVRPSGTNPAAGLNAHLAITPQFLDAVIRETRAAGYDFIGLDEVPERLDGPPNGRRFAAFTLDDGYRDNAIHAAPVFRKHDVPYTIFVTSGFTGASHTIWWETAAELVCAVPAFEFDFGGGTETVVCRSSREKAYAFCLLSEFADSHDEDEAVELIDAAASRNGVDAKEIVKREIMSVDEVRDLAKDPLARFGAHSVSHRNLARLPLDRLRREIVDSADAVENWTGMRPRSFAYPYGWRGSCGAREADAVAAAGLDLAVTTWPGTLDETHRVEPGLLPRVSLNGHYQRARYVRALLSGLPFVHKR